MIEIYNSDCFEKLKDIKSGSVDCIINDPPYFLSNSGITCKSGKMVSVNKGEWDKSKGYEEIYDFLDFGSVELRQFLAGPARPRPNGVDNVLRMGRSSPRGVHPLRRGMATFRVALPRPGHGRRLRHVVVTRGGGCREQVKLVHCESSHLLSAHLPSRSISSVVLLGPNQMRHAAFIFFFRIRAVRPLPPAFLAYRRSLTNWQ